MSARILDGKAIATSLRSDIKREVEQLAKAGISPGLAVILVGNDVPSVMYVKTKTRACQEAGIKTFDHFLVEETPQHELLNLIQDLNRNSAVHGILLQLPLPKHLDAQCILNSISPQKDVDGLLPENVGLLWQGTPRFAPCTPSGILKLLQAYSVALAGTHAVVIGRSQLVGKPVAGLLLSQNCTVTMAHSKTKNLEALVQQADLVIAAVGQPGLIKGKWIKEGATVIDVGINRLPDKTIVGDVEFQEAYKRASFITPVPGGVGPMTIAMLLQNTLQAALMRAHLNYE